MIGRMVDGCRVETKDGFSGRLLETRWTKRRDDRGVWRDQAIFYVELYDGPALRIRCYEPGEVYPADEQGL